MEPKPVGNMRAEAALIATNPSTHRGILDCSAKCGLVAFGSGPLVYLSSPVQAATFCSLRGHKQTVTGVKWIDLPGKTFDLVSISVDGTLVHWRARADPAKQENWVLQKSYPGVHKTNIELLATLVRKDSVYLATFDIDGTLAYWKSKNPECNELEVVKTLNFGKSLLEAVALYALNDKTNLMAVGGFTSQIHIYVHNLGTADLSYKCSLSGHQNSIRDLAFVPVVGSVLMASGSMDTTIRLWRIRPLEKQTMQNEGVVSDEVPTELHEQYKSKTSYVFDAATNEFFNIALESVLTNHAEGVNSVRWGTVPGKSLDDPKLGLSDLRLISGSIDRSICCWATGQDTTGTWAVVSTLGEMLSKDPIHEARFVRPDSTEILAYTSNGCIMRWEWSSGSKRWEQTVAPTGHFNSVNDVLWDPSEQLLISCGSDMQTKVYGRWTNAGAGEHKDHWYEISRPQIHGYEINGVVACPAFEVDPGNKMRAPFRLVSAGDEKVLRVFDPPYIFMKMANELSGCGFKYSKEKENAAYEASIKKSALSGTGASTNQPLALMNKPVTLAGEGEEEGNPSSFNPDSFLTNKVEQSAAEAALAGKVEPPLEHFLSNFGLWPEAQKLYGHAYEVQTIAISHDGKCIASSAKANKAKDAYIILWDTQTLKQVGKLAGHQLLVTQMEFSNDDKRLLSVGRDRQWILFGSKEGQFALEQKKPEAHGRAIWSCNWAPDDKMFATVSREKKMSIKFWSPSSSGEWLLDSSITELRTASAIRFFPELGAERRVVAGSEEGDLTVWHKAGAEWTQIYAVSLNLCHGGPVQRLVFNRRFSKENAKKWLLASGSADRSVRIFKFSDE